MIPQTAQKGNGKDGEKMKNWQRFKGWHDAAKIVTRLPCGGRIELHFYSVPSAAGVNKVTVVCLPEIYCSGSYSQVDGCPWFNRLRDFYSNTRAWDERCVDRDEDAGVIEAKVDYGDGKVRHVRYGESSGIVICGGNIFQNGQLRIVPFEEGNDVFEYCVDVNTWHARIMAFFKRLIGRRAK